MPGALPMRGGAAAIEQAGFGEDIGAGTNAGDADPSPCRSPHERQRLLASRRGFSALSACHDQGADRAGGLKTTREHSALKALRTGPGVAATTLIDGDMPAKRAPISNTEIGPAASSN